MSFEHRNCAEPVQCSQALVFMNEFDDSRYAVSCVGCCNARFGVPTLMNMKNTVFWDITPCSSLKTNRRCGETWHLRLYDWRISQARNRPESRWQSECSTLGCNIGCKILGAPDQGVNYDEFKSGRLHTKQLGSRKYILSVLASQKTHHISVSDISQWSFTERAVIYRGAHRYTVGEVRSGTHSYQWVTQEAGGYAVHA